MAEIIHYPEHAIGPNPGPMGWEDEPDWVSDQLMRMPNPMLADTPYYAEARCIVQGHTDIMPWVLEERALGARLRAHYQARGTCVSQAFARGVQMTSLADMVIGNQGEEWVARVHPGSIYGASRVEIGGGRLRGDGSLGAWAIQAVKKYGVLYRLQYGQWDLTGDGDEVYAIDWGSRGVPDELEPTMREHPIEDGSIVLTGAEYSTVAYDWRFVPVCSQQGYTTVRDKYGLCYPSGRWSHCMLAAGLILIKHDKFPSGLLCVPIYQSWGNGNPSGNDIVTLQTGEQIKLPPGVFLITLEMLEDRMLPARDSFVMTGSKGWVPRPADERKKLWLPNAA